LSGVRPKESVASVTVAEISCLKMGLVSWRSSTEISKTGISVHCPLSTKTNFLSPLLKCSIDKTEKKTLLPPY